MKNLKSRYDEKEREMQEEIIFSPLEEITLELGVSLLPLAIKKDGEDVLKNEIVAMRKNIQRELGIQMPLIHVIDNTTIRPYSKYQIRIKDYLVADGQLMVNRFLALKTSNITDELVGESTKDPIYNSEAYWITEDKVLEAKEKEYTVVEPITIMTAHLKESIKENFYMLLTRQRVKDMVDNLKYTHSILIEEIEKEEISFSLIQKVLQSLLKENISLRDLPLIIESIIDATELFDKLDEITNYVRGKMAHSLSEMNKNNDGKIYSVIFDQEEEEKLSRKVYENAGEFQINLSYEVEKKLVEDISEEIEKLQSIDITPIIVLNDFRLRFSLAKVLKKYKLNINVLTANEIINPMKIEAVKNFKVI